MVLTKASTYEEVCRLHQWKLPARFNMGVDVCDKNAAATPEKPGLIVADADGGEIVYSFLALKRLSDRLANVLGAHGLKPGDRMGIFLSQSIEAAIGHVAAWKLGAISIPLFTLFGEDALGFRLKDSGARVLITDTEQLHKLEAIRAELPALETVLVVGAGKDGANGMVDFWTAMDKASDAFTPIDSAAEDPAFICYTSGTTGNPKGALHAHRTMFGHLTGMEMFHDFLPQPGDLMWTPADWAWIGGLMNCLMCSWHHGVTNLAYRARKYDPEATLRLMARFGVRNTFMPPTALNLMRQVADIPSYRTNLRTVAVAGEPMGVELLDWGRKSFGLTFNEFYGQTECNLVLANCQEIMPVKPGHMGRAAPGHRVEIIDADGNVLEPGQEGEIGVLAPDPVMLLQYWNNKEASDAKITNGWWRMGDAAVKDEDGYFRFVGRADDVITTAGYRVGPGEIEDCLIKHPAVSLAAAIGVPDPVRTESIKVFIKLMPGHNGGPDLEEDIRCFVKTRLSPHEYPRMIEFVADLPLTATGKIKRKDLRDAEVAKQAAKAQP
jgi:acetyl-CoA synthetase